MAVRGFRQPGPLLPCWHAHTHTHTHTDLHLFVGPLPPVGHLFTPCCICLWNGLPYLRCPAETRIGIFTPLTFEHNQEFFCPKQSSFWGIMNKLKFGKKSHMGSNSSILSFVFVAEATIWWLCFKMCTQYT